MNTLVLFSRQGLDSQGERLLQVAAERGWYCRAGGGPAEPVGAALPAEWDREVDWAPTVRYEDALTARLLPEGLFRGEGPVVVRNGRFAASLEDARISQVLDQTGADVVAIGVSARLGGYGERLLAGRDGKVLGFRRFYQPAMAPAALPQTYPHYLVFGKRGLEALRETGMPARFTEAVSVWRSKGCRVCSYEVSGDCYDLASGDGMLLFLARAGGGARARVDGPRAWISPHARLVGDVLVESGVTVEDGAIVIGPSFLGTGSRVAANCLVRASAILPGAEVTAGGIVRDSVVLKGEVGDGRMADTILHGVRQRVSQGLPHAFRQWRAFSYARLGKRTLDAVGSIVALAGLAIIFPVVGVAIKLNSRGPIFFRHRRQGMHGREFWCLKFRTMASDADMTKEELRAINEVDGPQFKVEHDPRITLVGEFLRETNIDEIPQFVNVLLGQMSIVGPRPSPDEENQMCPWWREARLSVRPGITGLWQVSRSEDRSNDFQEWIYYDVEYVRKLSFMRDLGIMFKTVLVILKGFARLFTGRRGE